MRRALGRLDGNIAQNIPREQGKQTEESVDSEDTDKPEWLREPAKARDTDEPEWLREAAKAAGIAEEPQRQHPTATNARTPIWLKRANERHEARRQMQAEADALKARVQARKQETQRNRSQKMAAQAKLAEQAKATGGEMEMGAVAVGVVAGRCAIAFECASAGPRQ